MLASYLINWGCNPFLERLAWFIKKSKQFNQSDIASDIAAVMLTLSVNLPLPGEGRLCRSAVDVPMDDVLVPHDAVVFTLTKYKETKFKKRKRKYQDLISKISFDGLDSAHIFFNICEAFF